MVETEPDKIQVASALLTDDADIFEAVEETAAVSLRRFFQDYKQLENKIVEVEEIASVEMAYPVIEDALHRYSNQRQRGFRA